MESHFMNMVSIIMPCRNEEKFIKKCIDSIIHEDYPKDKLEVLVFDGMSEDRTKAIIEEYSKHFHYIRCFDNQKKIVSTAMNLGIKKAKGNIIIRMDAHIEYGKNYISKIVTWLGKSNADNVGGVCITLPGADSIKAKTIALALSSPFGVGNSMFRIGIKKPVYVDTVPFGAYRKEVFHMIGIFDERLVRNQDIEFNLRLKKRGGKILLVPDVISYYYARTNLKDLFKQNFWNGFWVIYSLKFNKLTFSLRHLVPLIFVLCLIGSFVGSVVFKPFHYLFVFVAGSYLTANTLLSCKLSLRNGIDHFIMLVVSFVTLHFSYGFGSIWGLLQLAFPYKEKT